VPRDGLAGALDGPEMSDPDAWWGIQGKGQGAIVPPGPVWRGINRSAMTSRLEIRLEDEAGRSSRVRDARERLTFALIPPTFTATHRCGGC
jgi:hypothetical protein